MERAVIYNRCSTEEEAQINALEVQAQESREIVLNQGWQLIEQYIESQSGTTSGKRTEYQRLLADMETDWFDIVVIKSIDRLMRSAKDWYCFVDRLTRNHKRLYIYIDHKFYTPDDSLLTGIKAILAEDFSRELSKKIKNAHKRRQEKQTGYNITVPIFGWDKVSKDIYVLNEKEAEAYRLAFSMAEQGMGFYSIANRMYAMGVRGKNGNRISDVQWRNMLHSPRAHGTVVLHTAEYDFEAKQKVKLSPDKWIYIDNALPPIISKEYHDWVLEKMTARSKEYQNTCQLSGQYALSGKLYCGNCGAVYYRTVVRGKQGERVVWKCSTALKHGRKTAERPHGCNNCNVEEEYVLGELEKVSEISVQCGFKNAGVEEVMLLLQKGLAQSDEGREKQLLVKELRKAEKKKKILLYKLMDEIIGDKEFQGLSQELNENIERIEKRIKNIEGLEREYNDYDKRLSGIREALQCGVIARAKARLIIPQIDKIMVHSDKRIELQFPKNL